MRINVRRGEGIAKSRRGEMTWQMVLSAVIVIFLIFGVALPLSSHMRSNANGLMDSDFCLVSPNSNMKGIAGGRCFSRIGCDGSGDWELVDLPNLCNDRDKPYCCRLSDPNTYYPPGTLEVQLNGDYQSTFRISETGSSTNPNGKHPLKFEVGESGTEEYATKGLPKKAPLYFRYRPKYESTEKCTLTYGNEKKVKKTVDCDIEGFYPLNKNDKLYYKQLSGGGRNKLVSIQITEEPATQTTPTTGQGTPSTSSTPKTVEYKIPFDLGG